MTKISNYQRALGLGAMIAVSALIVQCGEKKPAQESTAGAASSSAQADTVYKADAAASSIQWKGSKLHELDVHKGTIALKSGTMGFKDGAPVSGSFEIDMASIKNTDIEDPKYNAKLVGHLKNEDFFDVEKFPTAKFELVSASKGAAANQFDITGNLTIKGKTHSISAPATVTTSDAGATTEAVVTFDRTKFDVRYGSETVFTDIAKDKAIDDKIEITLKVALVK